MNTLKRLMTRDIHVAWLMALIFASIILLYGVLNIYSAVVGGIICAVAFLGGYFLGRRL